MILSNLLLIGRYDVIVWERLPSIVLIEPEQHNKCHAHIDHARSIVGHPS